MADIKKSSIANSVKYTIGGREYSARDVSSLRPTQTNDNGNVKTKSVMTQEAVEKTKSQTETYYKTGEYEKKEQSINDSVNQSPVKVSGVQTGTVRTTSNSSSSFFTAVNGTRDKHISIQNATVMVGGKAQTALTGQNDLGTQAAGMGIGTGLAGAQVFKAAQTATEIAPSFAKGTVGSLCSVGKGVYQVGLTGGMAAVAVSRTAAFVQAGQFHPLSHASMQMLKAQAISMGLNNTAVSQRIIHSVTGIHNKIQSGIQTARYVGDKVKTGYHVLQNGMRVVRGVTNGTIPVKVVASHVANKAVSLGALGIKTGISIGLKTGKFVIVKGVTKGVPFITFRAVPKVTRSIYGGITSIGGVMQRSEDWAIRGTGNAIKVTDIGLKTTVKGVKIAGKATGYTVHTAVKGGTAAGRATIAAGKFIKNNGLKAAWQAGRKKAFQAAVKGGKSVVSAAINLVKVLGKKLVVPLIVIVVVVMGFNGMIMIPVTSVSSIFSSFFSTKDSKTDYDVREYLNTVVPALSTNLQQELVDEMQSSRSKYNIVRFYSNTGSQEVVDPTLAGISSVFPTNDEILNMIQPIFNSVVLMKYDLEPTEAEAKSLAEEIFSKLFSITSKTSVEYCGQDIKTGEGTANELHCGSIHALDDCPNKITGTHSNYTCDDCCYYDCPGHSDSEGSIYYCGGCEHHCSGYTYCGSHSVIAYTLSVDGIYRLEAEYFLGPIEELSNLPNRTDEQETQLQELKDYHEIFQEMMSQVSINYGGGLTMTDLSGVQFVNGTRTANQDVINLALSQVGQMGGQPYWSYYGFSSRVEWCACFVHWCMRQTPSATSHFPTTNNNAGARTLRNWFVDAGQFGDKNYTNLVAGDCIFFDWEPDGLTDHVGLVIGTDGNKVYTVEGNSGDAVKIKSYPIGSSVIDGYGLMNY